MEKEKVTEELVRQNGNQAAAVMADFAGGGGGTGGSVPKFSDFIILESFTEEEVELWAAANADSENVITGGYKLNKKVLEKLWYLEKRNEFWDTASVNSIGELDDDGDILAISVVADVDVFLAKNSSKWTMNVPDSVSDDYFYGLQVQGPH